MVRGLMVFLVGVVAGVVAGWLGCLNWGAPGPDGTPGPVGYTTVVARVDSLELEGAVATERVVGSYVARLASPVTGDAPAEAGTAPESHGRVAGWIEPLRVEGDSVCLPVVSRRFEGEGYVAWVSGPIDPRLDSLRLTMPVARRAPSRWSVGLGVGLGVGARTGRVEPFVGVVASWRIF